ncbi:TetR/AcrR family transcriptional regulator [Rhizobium sp. YIM 134829]|uniref:TetR/AcrR family transcriptional regulator n=1 Tax=Rhizobium sp. YIM 134829 TaxID=3390453 RepID=UPI0039787DE6
MLSSSSPQADYSPRQNAVLDSALRLLVSGGEKALTTAGVARAANCSKESLYKWFGDRDGLLAAMIGFQASKVRTEIAETAPLDRAAFAARLTLFARDLLEVLASDVSLALNRLAIGQASREGSHLGQALEESGRRQIRRRAGALLARAREAGLIAYENADEAYETLYGLIVTDLHLRLLLGAAAAGEKDFGERAGRAVAAFLALYGREEKAGR